MSSANQPKKINVRAPKDNVIQTMYDTRNSTLLISMNENQSNTSVG